MILPSSALKKAGLSDKVDIKITDYRDLESQSFDKVVSIEMFEAVGMAYWPTYFNKVSDVLRKGGKAALQVITIVDEEFESYRTTPDFIQKYIFPGGMLPSIEKNHTANRGGWHEIGRRKRIWPSLCQDA